MSTTDLPASFARNHTVDYLLPQSTPLTPDEWHQRVQTTILFSFFGCLGIILNSLPILLTAFTEMRKNKVNVMVANLSTSDLLFSVSFVFGQTQYILYREQIDFTGCRWLAFFTFTTAFFEFIFPPFLSINRYISLYYAERYDKTYTTRNIFFMVVGSWAFCTIVPLIFTLSGKTGFDDDNLHCCIIVKYSHWGWTVFYWMVIIVPLVAFCDGTMMFCNYKIYKKLTDHSAKTLKRTVVSQNREILYFLVADMTFPILFHTTYHVAKFASAYRFDLTERRVFTCLYLINSCVRGGVTLTMLRPYRRALRNLLRCVWCRGIDTNTVAPMLSETGKIDNIPASSNVAVAGASEAVRDATYKI